MDMSLFKVKVRRQTKTAIRNYFVKNFFIQHFRFLEFVKDPTFCFIFLLSSFPLIELIVLIVCLELIKVSYFKSRVGGFNRDTFIVVGKFRARHATLQKIYRFYHEHHFNLQSLFQLDPLNLYFFIFLEFIFINNFYF